MKTTMRTRCWSCSLLLLLVVVLVVTVSGNEMGRQDDGEGSGSGSGSGSERLEAEFQELFLSMPKPFQIKDNLKFLANNTHIAGSPGDYATAKFVYNAFKASGLDAEIQPFEALASLPLTRVVSIVYPDADSRQLELEEAPIKGDPTSYRSNVPTFNAYSANGDVTAEVLYVNYGRIEDYEALEKLNISVAGKIALARYGMIFRGSKVMIAQEKGAVGVIIYSDPADDGYSRGEVYPKGPWRPATGVQRGSIQYLSICPGDPRRVDKCLPKDSKKQMVGGLIPSIPVQPISYGDAKYIFKSMGKDSNAISVTSSTFPVGGWKGGIDATYVVGSNTQVRLAVQFNMTAVTMWNVIGTLKGSINPDKYVLMGNHRDAWVFGAADPSSGTATLLEIARSFGALKNLGWTPDRTIKLCSWDGEEYGLLGSTYYAETNADDLQENAVVYINGDMSTGTNFYASGTPSLASFFRNITARISYPNSTMALSEHWNGDFTALGSGSDFTAFIDHLGIASMHAGFDGPYGVYHSNYDSFTWYDTFGDPTYEYLATLAKVLGLTAMSIADSELVPLNYIDYANSIASYIDITKALAKTYALDEHIDFSSLEDSLTAFNKSAVAAADQVKSTAMLIDGLPKKNTLANEVNDRLVSAERKFLMKDGLSDGRPWYKHCIQAPALYNGYGADVFPALSSAIRDGDVERANAEIVMIAKHLDSVSESIDERDEKQIKIAVILFVSIVIGGAVLYVYRRRMLSRSTVETIN